MAILIDFNQIVISTVLATFKPKKTSDLKLELIRHSVLDSLRAHRTRFKHEYGEMIICCDSKKSWRKNIFPYYKAHRKLTRDKSLVDWNTLFSYIETIIQELIDTFPYKVLQVNLAEADDIIAVLAGHLNEKTVIVSGDGDFMQLQKYSHISQYDPIRKNFMKGVNHLQELHQKIVGGDAGDGIPNILSDDDTFMIKGKRQVMLSPKRKERLYNISKFEMEDDEILKYDRNQKLIDLSFIPIDLKDQIKEAYDSYVPNDRSGILKYLSNHNLKVLMDSKSEF